MKNIIQKTTLALTLLLAFAGCQDDTHSFGEVNAPENLQVTTQIVGQDADHPNGDGSGFVNFTSTATHAVSYKYIFSDGTSEISGSGEISKRFSQPGLPKACSMSKPPLI